MQIEDKKIQNEIWILADKRPGTAAQAIGLAEEMGLPYKIIDLDYSLFASLPNIFLSSSLIRLTEGSRREVVESGHFPKIVISAGRRSAPIALYLKEASKNQTKIVQIMNPNLDFKKFDFVILPQHDGLKEENFSNLITTIGALSRVDDERLVSEAKKFPELQKITKRKITLLLGGSSNKTEFTAKSAEKLTKIISNIAKKMDATLLVLNSRRSSPEVNQAVKSSLEGQNGLDYQFFDWNEMKGENPYFAVLNCSDFFVITGDSVSMISECCSTGKPVYIFDEEEISSPKHRRFHEELVVKNYAKKLSPEPLEDFSPEKLAETKRVANLIKSSL